MPFDTSGRTEMRLIEIPERQTHALARLFGHNRPACLASARVLLSLMRAIVNLSTSVTRGQSVQQVTAYAWPEEDYEVVAEHATNEKK